MYEKFFSLEAPPFVLTPDPRFLFRSRGHHDVLASLLYGITSQKGTMALIGDVGTGKTTLCRALLQELPEDVQTALILNPHLSDTELLGAILDDLGLERRGRTKGELMTVLGEHLLAAGAAGRTVVIMLDEAQHLSFEALEQIRILSNLETPSRKLLQILLVGQTELEERLAQTQLRQLDQRIAIRCRLQSLSRDETYRYIEHRLRAAGLSGSPPFTRPAMARVYRRSRGTPRLVNLICDRALAAAYSSGARLVDDGPVRLAIRNVSGRRPATSRTRGWRIAGATAAAAAAITIGVAGGTAYWYARTAPGTALQPVAASAAETRATTPAESASPVSEPALPSDSSLLAQLIVLWGVTEDVMADTIASWPRRGGAADVPTIAERYELSATYLPHASLADLRAIGLPALVIVREPWGEQTYLLRRTQGGAVTLVDADGAKVPEGAERLGVTPPIGAWIVWRNVDRLPTDPAREATPTVIATAALRLHKLGYLAAPLPATYEARLGDAVRAFQREVGLPDDGLLGPRTTLALARVVGGRFGPTIVDGSR